VSIPATQDEVSGPGAIRWMRPAHRVEDAAVAMALVAMAVLPMAEVVVRALFDTHVPSGIVMVQHLVLVVGMLGGALAAREGRLLAFAGAARWIKGGVETFAHIVAGGFAAAMSILLCAASLRYVLSQRTLGKILAFGIPVWTVQALLVLGFALIALRVLWRSGTQWRWRVATGTLALVIVVLSLWPPVDPSHLRWPAMLLMGGAVLLGAPIFTALGGAAIILLWSGGEPVSPVPLKLYQLTVNPTLPSIPLFTLAGYLLAESQAPGRLVRLFQALFGSMRGGTAIATTLVCAFFTSFTGASGATILALGGVLFPVLVAARYSERNALGLLTGAGSLGMLFPPCLPPILYAIIASSSGQVSVSIEQMFKGGFIPGLLLVGMTAWWGIRCGPRLGAEGRQPFVLREALGALWEARWEMLVPVVAITMLFSGFATPVEAASVTVCYTFLVVAVIHKDLRSPRRLVAVVRECGILMGGVLLILGVALGFTHYLVDAEIPDIAVAWATSTIESKWVFLLLLNLVLLIIGGLVEIYAAIVVVVPLLVPIGIAFGMDPVHLGIIFLANMELGFLAPPVGLNLLLASYRFNRPMSEVTRVSLPMLGVMVVGVLLITYIPWLTTWLPSVWP